MLLEAGASLYAYNKDRDSAVLICCRTGQSLILDMLFKRMNATELQFFLNTAAEIDGFPPLLAAAELDKTECIKICHKYGAALEYRTKNDNQVIQVATALHLAAYYGRAGAIKTLYELGCDVLAQTAVHGYTALHIAIKQNHPTIVRYLLALDKGKECLQIQDSDGRLPQYYANIAGNEAIMEEFFTNKLSVIMDKILWSGSSQANECCEVLLKYGQSLGCFDYNDITPLELGGNGSSVLTAALLHNNTALIDALQK